MRPFGWSVYINFKIRGFRAGCGAVAYTLSSRLIRPVLARALPCVKVRTNMSHVKRPATSNQPRQPSAGALTEHVPRGEFRSDVRLGDRTNRWPRHAGIRGLRCTPVAHASRRSPSSTVSAFLPVRHLAECSPLLPRGGTSPATTLRVRGTFADRSRIMPILWRMPAIETPTPPPAAPALAAALAMAVLMLTLLSQS